ncbi:MmgE/PrpD family protein [Variovorax sp. 38R]|uniref:MmgE/PrpD family protein n=1 Tax=Variovorax sp. 38R TaxID=2774875 RepID=UPI001CE131C7|nr:MmgE/PrpD family protein [Variovorax sp. 38R]
MKNQTCESIDSVAVTHLMADWISRTDDAALTPSAYQWAKHAMFDWLAVSIAGSSEPLVQILADAYQGSADQPCLLLASGRRGAPHDAALINGAAGHALDYDDVASRMFGHPTVPVAPAVLALAQSRAASGRDLLRALVVGHEIESRLGEIVGPSHYQYGFHATGTVGTFGAAAACANLRGLSSEQTAHALGLAATQAAGLKCMFGTMGKPLHAGKAAMNGLMAAELAARGFTVNDSAIECVQGFARTMAPALNGVAPSIDTRNGFAVEQTLFKYHASCYLTHSTIEAIRALRQHDGVDLDALESMTLQVAGNHRGVCDIAVPQSGLNVKFSIQHLAALALDGADTSDLGLYSDQTALDARYAAAARCMSMVVVEAENRDAATVTMHTRDGRTLSRTANVAIPATDLDAQWTRLLAKARAIAEPVLGAARFERFVEAVDALDRSPSLHPLFEAIQ